MKRLMITVAIALMITSCTTWMRGYDAPITVKQNSDQPGVTQTITLNVYYVIIPHDIEETTKVDSKPQGSLQVPLLKEEPTQ